MTRYIIFLFFGLLVFSCKEDKPTRPDSVMRAKKPQVKIPVFSGDNAFANIEKQLAFGTRVPGTPTHVECKNWLVSELKNYGAEVIEQDFKASFLTVTDAPATNIIAQFNPDMDDRVLLCAHWDSRLIAEKDDDVNMRDKPIMGADDGGSGVGVLLEIARLIQENPIDLGVDIVLFDAEDNGLDRKNWCIGSKYWSKNLHKTNYGAEFGILLDMVGAKGAQFPLEGYSAKYALPYLKKIWNLAEKMQAGDLFIKVNGHGIEDDHLYVNQNAKIPTVDIINLSQGDQTFGAHHHTHDDNIDIISKNTLRKVGQVVTAVIYNQSCGRF